MQRLYLIENKKIKKIQACQPGTVYTESHASLYTGLYSGEGLRPGSAQSFLKPVFGQKELDMHRVFVYHLSRYSDVKVERE